MGSKGVVEGLKEFIEEDKNVMAMQFAIGWLGYEEKHESEKKYTVSEVLELLRLIDDNETKDK